MDTVLNKLTALHEILELDCEGSMHFLKVRDQLEMEIKQREEKKETVKNQMSQVVPETLNKGK